MSLEVRNISKSFGSYNALRDINLRVEQGELVALLGPSGSGKTTLLRIIAGLEVPDPRSDSSLLFTDEDITDRPASHRQVGFVFQHYALFRHMSVFENVAFGLRVKRRSIRPSKSQIESKVHELLRLVQLDGLAYRYPSQLSGGQRQRVALARALAVEPRMLLLDEPFGALDAKVRQELRQWLRRLHDELQVTSIFVTHDQEEALEVADRIVILNEGRIIQVGTPSEVFHNPANEFVMHFLGRVNVFSGRVEGGKAFFNDIEWDYPAHDEPVAKPARALVRPHNLILRRYSNGGPQFAAIVLHINEAGPVIKVELRRDGGESVFVEVTRAQFANLRLERGHKVFVTPKDIRVFVDSDERVTSDGDRLNHSISFEI